MHASSGWILPLLAASLMSICPAIRKRARPDEVHDTAPVPAVGDDDLEADGDPDEAAQNEFAGGHAENMVFDEKRCEVWKTHASPVRYQGELAFLKAAANSTEWAPLVPQFRGEKYLHGRPFIVMQNVICKMKRPVIADFKLGTQSWKPDFGGVVGAEPEKRATMERLDDASTTKTLGVRITSIQLPPAKGNYSNVSIPEDADYSVAGRKAVKLGKDKLPGEEWRAASNEQDFNRSLREYLGTKDLQDRFVEKLQPFLELFRQQTTYRFTGASLFVYYDAVGAWGKAPELGMTLIDFPHTVGSPGNEYGAVDAGALLGLETLRSMAARM